MSSDLSLFPTLSSLPIVVIFIISLFVITFLPLSFFSLICPFFSSPSLLSFFSFFSLSLFFSDCFFIVSFSSLSPSSSSSHRLRKIPVSSPKRLIFYDSFITSANLITIQITRYIIHSGTYHAHPQYRIQQRIYRHTEKQQRKKREKVAGTLEEYRETNQLY